MSHDPSPTTGAPGTSAPPSGPPEGQAAPPGTWPAEALVGATVARVETQVATPAATAPAVPNDTTATAPVAQETPAKPKPVTSLKDADWNSIKSPWLLTKTISSLGLAIVSSLTFGYSIYGLDYLEKRNFEVPDAAGGILILMLLFLVTLAGTILGTILSFQFLAKNWKLHIRGHNLVCSYNREEGKIYYEILPRGEKLPKYYRAFILPLTGWFKGFGRIVSQFDDQWNYSAQHWTIGTHWVERNLIDLDELTTEGMRLWILLSDHGTSGLLVTPEQAFRIIDTSTLQLTPPDKSWQHTLLRLFKEGDDLRTAWEEVGRLKQELEESADVIFEAVTRIDATKRFILSTDALKIREWLVTELLKRLPEKDPRRKLFVKSEGQERAASQS